MAAAKRRSFALKKYPLPTQRQWRQHEVLNIRPNLTGYDAYFANDMVIHMHRGQGTGRIYAMRPQDRLHERREPTPEVRRTMQFSALMALLDYFGSSTDADFFVGADGDVLAQYAGFDRSPSRDPASGGASPKRKSVKRDPSKAPKLGSRWIAEWAQDRTDAIVWTVRGVTPLGVYITSPESRSPGHLMSPTQFFRDYVPFRTRGQ